jgi:predicted nucleic acid-binding protein
VTDYLVDNSVWARLEQGDPGIVTRLLEIADAPADLFVTCPPQVLEFCHSAQSPQEYAVYRSRITLGFPLENAPAEAQVLNVQKALWDAGMVRAAGSADILIACYAMVNDATVLCADHESGYIARVCGLRQEYLAPAG